MKTSHSQRRRRGFSLVELMVALTVMAVVLAVGMPSYRNFSNNSRMVSSINRLAGSIHYARSQALSRAEQVVLCKGSSAACVTTNDWRQGWIIFADADVDGSPDAGELLNVQEPLSIAISSFGATAGAVNAITFSAGGRTTLTGTQTFILCDSRGFGAAARALVVTPFGATSPQKATDTGETACL